ncbi:MAG: hypothetical protein KatS3mg115_2193 [Candidatus Poribacteria bacterium]|nr:MAG: hypothetical protein KatS3mg115_2193 [Candidatus Poribacteria bacterium]
MRDWDLRAEYVFVNPWNYTHEIEGLNFAIFDRPVGYRLGPDAESLWLEGSRALRRNVRVGGVLFRDRKGEVQIGTVHRKDDPSEWEYLFGTIETQRGLKLFGEWTHWGRGHLRLEIGWRWVRNRDHQPNVHRGRSSSTASGAGGFLTLPLTPGVKNG